MTSKPSYMVIVLEIYADSGAYRFRFAAADECDSCGLRFEKFFEFPAVTKRLVPQSGSGTAPGAL